MKKRNLTLSLLTASMLSLVVTNAIAMEMKEQMTYKQNLRTSSLNTYSSSSSSSSSKKTLDDCKVKIVDLGEYLIVRDIIGNCTDIKDVQNFMAAICEEVDYLQKSERLGEAIRKPLLGSLVRYAKEKCPVLDKFESDGFFDCFHQWVKLYPEEMETLLTLHVDSETFLDFYEEVKSSEGANRYIPSERLALFDNVITTILALNDPIAAYGSAVQFYEAFQAVPDILTKINDGIAEIQTLMEEAKNDRATPANDLREKATNHLIEALKKEIVYGEHKNIPIPVGKKFIKDLIDNGANLNAVCRVVKNITALGVENSEECDILALSARNGHAAIVKMLLHPDESTRGLNIDRDKVANALKFAVKYGHADVVSILLNFAKSNSLYLTSEEIGYNLGATAYYGHEAVTAQLIKIASGGSLNQKIDGFRDNNFEEQYYDSEQGDPWINEIRPWSYPFILAAERGHAAVVHILMMRSDLKVNYVNKGGMTALGKASENNHTEVVKILLANPQVNPNIANNCLTPLALAANWGNIEIVRELLRRNDINVNAFGNKRRNALMVAAEGNRVAILKELLKRDDLEVNAFNLRWNALRLAVQYNNIEIVKELLKHPGLDVNAFANDESALALAVKKGRINIVTELLKHPRLDLSLRNKNNDTPLDMAAKQGKENFVNAMLYSCAFSRTTIKEATSEIDKALKPEEKKAAANRYLIYAMKRVLPIRGKGDVRVPVSKELLQFLFAQGADVVHINGDPIVPPVRPI